MLDDTYRARLSFPSTHWSLVGRVGQENGAGQHQALEQLLIRYLPALKAHLLHRRRIASDWASDLLQGFITDKILERRLIERADRGRGKFRTFLLTALDNYVVSEIRRESAKKRSPGDAALVTMDEARDHGGLSASVSDVFDLAWAREVLAEAVRWMQVECEKSGRTDIWGVFECRVLDPTLGQAEPLPYEQLVERFGFQSPTQASNTLITAKRMFARMLHSVVGEYTRDEAEIDAEIEDLRRILSTADA